MKPLIFIILLLSSCSSPKYVTVKLKRGTVRVAVMTNAELTIAVKKIEDNYAYPDSSFRIDSVGNFSLADTIPLKAIITPYRLFIGKKGGIIDTRQPDNNGDLKDLLEEYVTVRTYFERLTDSLFRVNDSLQKACNKLKPK